MPLPQFVLNRKTALARPYSLEPDITAVVHVSPCSSWNAWTQWFISIDKRPTTLLNIVTLSCGWALCALASSKPKRDRTVSHTTSADTGALLGRGGLGHPEVISRLCYVPGSIFTRALFPACPFLAWSSLQRRKRLLPRGQPLHDRRMAQRYREPEDRPRALS